ncbi:hypothetical protein [Kyrpidia spormannii]|uniref:Uncharacterized protein n=1 Tax=Kyrpidia spormannii TaxID=2055160 RepID=A0ACA8Z8S7_9BACL|nr:hypothetical protein [Kyrpidia spormannii]CAB3391060.1 protein of unknown function [Kyrpidia spormannii]
MNKKGVQGFILLETALVAVMAAVIWMTWAQWWAAVASSANRIDTGIEGEEQWRRLMVRLSREFHDADEVRGGEGGWNFAMGGENGSPCGWATMGRSFNL